LPSTASFTPTLDVVAQDLAVTLGTTLAQACGS
jgi:hypothetical protein